MRSILAFAAVLAVLSVVPASDARPWKDAAGKRTIEAEFVSLSSGKVTLKRSDGKIVTVALEKLSAADQQVAKELAAKAAPTADAAAVEVVGLAISKPSNPESGLMAPNMMMSGGVALTFIVPSGERHFIGFDNDVSRIAACTDDQGSDLTAAPEAGNNFGFFGPFNASISNDGQKCQVTATLPGVPKQGSTKINFDATLTILCGKDEKTEEQRDFALEPGSEITIGPVPLKVESAEDQDFGDVKFAVSFTSEKPRDAIKSLEFIGPDGEVLELQPMGSGSFGFGDQITYQASYGLKEKVDKVTVRMTYYSAVETLTVPVKIETGVGL